MGTQVSTAADARLVQDVSQQVARRVVGQDYMVDRLLISLLTGGHVLLEGVLLLTTDGEAAHKLTHPSAQLERTYVAHVRGDADAAVERVLEEGVELEDGPVHPRAARARHLGRGRWLFEVTLTEGRNREVRRLCEALDLQVDKLVRTQFGPITLGELAPGSSRTLTPWERTALGKLLGRAP